MEPRRDGRRWLVPLDGEYVRLVSLPRAMQREWRRYLSIRSKPCPTCGAWAVLAVGWGLPERDSFDEPHPPHVEMGCIVPPGPRPNRECEACGATWVQVGTRPPEFVEMPSFERQMLPGDPAQP